MLRLSEEKDTGTLPRSIFFFFSSITLILLKLKKKRMLRRRTYNDEIHSLDGYIVVSSSAESEWDLKPLRIPARFLGGPLASLSVKAPSIGIQAYPIILCENPNVSIITYCWCIPWIHHIPPNYHLDSYS